MEAKEFLKDFSDQEIAYFYKYRFKSYQNSTQNSLENYIFKERNLDIKKINILLKQKKGQGMCKRCGSSKNFSYLIDYYPTKSLKLSHYKISDFTTETEKIEQIECSVCGQIIYNPNENILLQLLKKIFDKQKR